VIEIGLKVDRATIQASNKSVAERISEPVLLLRQHQDHCRTVDRG
jgi:hypothetical protein